MGWRSNEFSGHSSYAEDLSASYGNRGYRDYLEYRYVFKFKRVHTSYFIEGENISGNLCEKSSANPLIFSDENLISPPLKSPRDNKKNPSSGHESPQVLCDLSNLVACSSISILEG